MSNKRIRLSKKEAKVWDKKALQKAVDKRFRLTPRQVQENFIALINSTVEGYTGQWDPTGEGRDGFIAMHDDLEQLAAHYGVDTAKAKDMED